MPLQGNRLLKGFKISNIRPRQCHLFLIPLLLALSVFVKIWQVAVIEDYEYCDARKTFVETRSFLVGFKFAI